MLPYFAGERTPLFDPDARGVVVGLTIRHTIGAAYRDAFLAAAGTGAAKPRDIDRWNPVARTIEPNPARAADGDQLYQLYLDLYPATRVTAHALAARRR